MRIIVGITGASGILYTKRLLEHLKDTSHFIDLIVSNSAEYIISHELADFDKSKLADKIHHFKSYGELASGTTFFDAMIIIPCSMKTLASINSGYADNLINRAADVSIKEGRELILCPRETPLSSIHLKNMYNLAKAGVCILPLIPGFYHKPNKILDLVDFVVAKIFNRLNIKHDIIEGWDKLIKI